MERPPGSLGARGPTSAFPQGVKAMVKMVDGHTDRVRISGQTESVRLIGTDGPGTGGGRHTGGEALT